MLTFPKARLGSRMLFIFRGAYASSERGLLTHIGPGFGGTVIGGATEVVDIRSGVSPDNGVTRAMHPGSRFRFILVCAQLSDGWAIEPVRQARPASAIRC
jgi:hypothetical protein